MNYNFLKTFVGAGVIAALVSCSEQNDPKITKKPSLEVTVLDSDGKAVADAKVVLYRGEEAYFRGDSIIAGMTDATGKFSYFEEETGTLYVEAAKGNLRNDPTALLEDGTFKTQDEIDAHATQSGAVVGGIKYKDINEDGVISVADESFVNKAELVKGTTTSFTVTIGQELMIDQLLLGKWELKNSSTRIFDADGVLTETESKEAAEYYITFDDQNNCIISYRGTPNHLTYTLGDDEIIINGKSYPLLKLTSSELSILNLDYDTGYGGESRLEETMNFVRVPGSNN